MTWKSISAFVVGACFALALGIWIGPSAQNRLASVTDPGVYDMEPMTTPPDNDTLVDTSTATPETRAWIARSRAARPTTRTTRKAQESGASNSHGNAADATGAAIAAESRGTAVDGSRAPRAAVARASAEPVVAEPAVADARTAIDTKGTRTGVLISPALARHVKPLLRSGADVTVAADGFRSAAEFVTVARAARNTGVPFMLLKHRVVSEGRSLARAIESSKPELDGTLEAQRAAAEARVDMAYFVG